MFFMLAWKNMTFKPLITQRKMPNREDFECFKIAEVRSTQQSADVLGKIIFDFSIIVLI